MARPGITEDDVWLAADKLQELNIKPSVDKILAELGTGSRTTINKHLNNWKKQRQRNSQFDSSYREKNLEAKNLELTKTLDAQIQQLQDLSMQLLNRDRKILQLEELLQVAKLKDVELSKEFEVKQLNLNNKIEVCQAEIKRLEQVINILREDFKNLHENYMNDIKAVNEQSLTKVREVSIQSQELLLDEKIKLKEANKKIDDLSEKIVELENLCAKERSINAPLREKIAYQEKLISHCLDPEKLENLSMVIENEQN